MTEPKLVYWLMLEMIFGIGSIRLNNALKICSRPEELYYMLHEPDNKILNDKERHALQQVTKEKARSILEYCQKHRIGVMMKSDECYPEALKKICNPPQVLFYKGDASLLHRKPLMTVVGARRPSRYSLRVTEELCRGLAQRNVIIVSGGAVGIDAASHWAALNEGKPTISVMGCGVDYDYPKENRAMREQIVQNGLLLTEYFPGTQPYPSNFPVRNRILAAISEGTLVVEASDRSGSLITANLACDNGKSVFCIPPADIFDRRYLGGIHLLQDGAIPVYEEADILAEINRPYMQSIFLYDTEEEMQTKQMTGKTVLQEAKPLPPAKTETSSAGASGEASAETQQPKIPEEATPEHRRILEFLQKGGQNVNAVCCFLELSFEQASMLLMEMEMNGWIVNTERDIFALPE